MKVGFLGGYLVGKIALIKMLSKTMTPRRKIGHENMLRGL